MSFIVCNAIGDKHMEESTHASTTVRCTLSILGLIAINAAAAAQPSPRRPRVAPWEIEPTEETKRRIEEGEIEVIDPGGDPQIVISARWGEPRVINFKLPPRSIQLRSPSKALVVWNGTRDAVMYGTIPGITTMTVIYPSPIAGEEDETIRYLIRVHVD